MGLTIGQGRRVYSSSKWQRRGELDFLHNEIGGYIEQILSLLNTRSY